MRFCIALILCLPCIATAQMPASESYLGVGLGSFDYELRSNGVTFRDASAATFTIYGGFWLGPRWAFEGSWQLTETSERPGPATASSQIAALGLRDTATTTTTAELEIVTLRTLRFVPYRWGSVFAGFGVSAASVDSKFEISDLSNSDVVRTYPRASKNGLTLAVGAQWDFRRVSLRLGYDWWDDDMSTIGLSMNRRL